MLSCCGLAYVKIIPAYMAFVFVLNDEETTFDYKFLAIYYV
jgi:hypothetical protein